MNAAASNWDDDPLSAWLVAIDGVVPPFCVEVVLTDGSRYSLHSMTSHDAHTGAAVMRIWDFRGLSDEELDGLRDRIMALGDAAILQQPATLHPRLAWAVVRLRLGEVAHCVESYAPLWLPREERPPGRPPGIGFGN